MKINHYRYNMNCILNNQYVFKLHHGGSVWVLNQILHKGN